MPKVGSNTIDLMNRISNILSNVTQLHRFVGWEFEFWVEEFGSSVSQLCTENSDIDLVLQGNYIPPAYDDSDDSDQGTWGSIDYLPYERSLSLLTCLTGHFASKGGFRVEVIPAGYPLLKIYDPRTGLKCDLCFPTNGSIDPRKDQVLLALNMVGERFRILFTLVKLWAEQHNLLGDLQSTLYLTW